MTTLVKLTRSMAMRSSFVQGSKVQSLDPG
jgi:hypothetical protein